MLLQHGETIENHPQILREYQQALITRQDRIDALYNEIKLIKNLRVN